MSKPPEVEEGIILHILCGLCLFICPANRRLFSQAAAGQTLRTAKSIFIVAFFSGILMIPLTFYKTVPVSLLKEEKISLF